MPNSPQPPRPTGPGNASPRPSGSASRVYRGRRKRARQKRLITLFVCILLIAVLFVTALLLAGGQPGGTSSAILPSSAATPSSGAGAVGSAVVPSSSVPSSLSLPPSSSVPQREPTPFDEEGPPPLYNYENFIPDGYLSTIELIDVGGGHRMEKRAGEAFLAMAEAALADGVNLVRISGYRSHEQQTNNYNASIQRYISWGYSEAEAIEKTQGWYAIPGTSEHEAALAMDVGDASNPATNIEESFKDTATYTWLQENCTRFGFILRYREEDFGITHIHSEPWHYRYVGANHAERIVELGVTLEEYTDLLKKGTV